VRTGLIHDIKPSDGASRAQLAMYSVLRTLVASACHILWRVRVKGLANVPKSGAYVVSPVHRSNVDTPLACLVTRRRLRYMGKDSLWKYKWSAWFFTTMGGFPVHRGTADRHALRQCVDAVQGGEPLVVFPEGTRRSGPVVEELYEGAAFVSVRTGVPIVPVGIGGSEWAMPATSRFIRPVKITMIVGRPIYPPSTADGRGSRRQVHELTEDLRKELQVLFDEAQAAAGRA
jgi:1-acyl-sn-glycerol-3-phosphate acyltransferase